VWTLSGLMGQEIPGGFITATIGFGRDGSVSGEGGCTGYTGTYTVDGTSISISGIASDPGTCAAGMDRFQEGLLAVMPFVHSYSIEDGVLHLEGLAGIQTTWTAQ